MLRNNNETNQRLKKVKPVLELAHTLEQEVEHGHTECSQYDIQDQTKETGDDTAPADIMQFIGPTGKDPEGNEAEDRDKERCNVYQPSYPTHMTPPSLYDRIRNNSIAYFPAQQVNSRSVNKN